jgi:hypothetical protein
MLHGAFARWRDGRRSVDDTRPALGGCLRRAWLGLAATPSGLLEDGGGPAKGDAFGGPEDAEGEHDEEERGRSAELESSFWKRKSIPTRSWVRWMPKAPDGRSCSPSSLGGWLTPVASSL